MDTTGFDEAPSRYVTDSGREAIDIIRDSMSDREFVVWCCGQALKYECREGKKAGTDDAEKARWYRLMADHVLGVGPDPRHERENFQPYVRKKIPDPLAGRPNIKVLDHGFLRLVETWGGGDARIPEAGIIEAARQSTQGSFRGWRRDRRLLKYLYTNKHCSPFEFAGMTIEVRAPIMVFRQWHRHRTASYNEASGRYVTLPELWYVPTLERVMADGGANKQAGAADGAKELTEEAAQRYLDGLDFDCRTFQKRYAQASADGVPKELARLGMPLNWYTQMRATANLRNWLAFLTLRMDPHAQWEIRQFANALYQIVEFEFPGVAKLFSDGR